MIYHPSARVDVFEIVEYYERKAGTELAADFFGELERLIDQTTSYSKLWTTEPLGFSL